MRALYVYDSRAKILTAALALLLAIPAIGSLFTNHEERSRWENRTLAELSHLWRPESGPGFFAKVDWYLKDHFGFALELNRLYRKVQFYVFHDSPSPDLSLGKDGFVFVTSYKSAPFSMLQSLCENGMKEDIGRQAAESWGRILTFLSNSHDHVALLIAPSKPVIYPEKFTTTVPRRYREACAAYLPEKSVSGAIARNGRKQGHIVIYPHKNFSSQKYDENFYPRENFHYSGRSAHWLGRNTLQQLGISVNNDYEESVHSKRITYDLMNLLGFTRELIYTDYPYTSFSIAKQVGSPAYVLNYFKHAQQFGVYQAGKPLTQRTALVIGNSFTTFTADHLAPGYRTLTYIMINGLQKDEVVKFFTELIPRIDADDIIFVYNDNVVPTAATNWIEELQKTVSM